MAEAGRRRVTEQARPVALARDPAIATDFHPLLVGAVQQDAAEDRRLGIAVELTVGQKGEIAGRRDQAGLNPWARKRPEHTGVCATCGAISVTSIPKACSAARRTRSGTVKPSDDSYWVMLIAICPPRGSSRNIPMQPSA